MTDSTQQSQIGQNMQHPQVPQGQENSSAQTSQVPPAEMAKRALQDVLKTARHTFDYLKPWIIVVGAIILGILIFMFAQRFIPRPTVVNTPQPTPTKGPTPTPVRTLSTVATQSGFLQLQEQVTSLSEDVRIYEIQDPALSPPELTLPLGFSED